MLFSFSKSKKIKLLSLLLLCAVLIPTNAILAAPSVLRIPGDILNPVPVADKMIRAKETGITVFGVNTGVSIDGLAIIVLREIVNALGDATIRWLNEGFLDSPAGDGQAFAVDLEKVFRDTGDAVAGNIINEISANNLCAPFQNNVTRALRNVQARRTVSNASPFEGRCKLSTIIGNAGDFFSGDFISGGGWNMWMAVTQDPMGNPYTSFLEIQSDIDAKVASEEGIRSQQLDWGSGFFATAKCAKKVEGDCVEFNPIKTPGAVIENQLQKVLNVEVDQLNMADEFDEVVTAIAGQLMGMVFNKTKGIFESTNRNYTGNSDKGATTPNQGTCYPDSETSLVGEPVTWSYVGATNNETTILEWSGDEGLTGTSDAATVTYNSAGEKKAQIKVIKKVANGTNQNGETIFRQLDPITVFCEPSVEVSRFGPLAISCTLNNKDTLYVPPPGQRTWTIKISGGSGQLRYVNLDEYKTLGRPQEGQPLMKAALIPGGTIQGLRYTLSFPDFSTPEVSAAPGVAGSSVPLDPSSPKTSGGIILTATVGYSDKSNGMQEFVFQEIADLDPSVPVLRGASCGDVGFDVFNAP